MLLDVFYIILILIIGWNVPKLISGSFSAADLKTLRQLFFYHLVIALYYCFFLYGDANRYYNVSKNIDYADFLMKLSSGNPTHVMEALTYPFSNVFGMSYLAATLFFSLFGYVAVVLFYQVALKTVPYNKLILGRPVFPLVFFLPNLHLWSVAIGKDTLLFMAVAMFSYSIVFSASRYLLMTIALSIAFLIRPHIVLFLLVGFGIASLFNQKLTSFQRYGLAAVLLGGSAFVLPIVLEFINVESFDAAALSQRAENQAGLLTQESGSAVDVSSYPFPLKVFTYLYRPLFFDARSVGALLSSLDNLILLILSITAFRYRPVETFRKAPFVIKGFLIFGILGTLAFSASLGNLGIMVRMKNMFTPGILIYFMWCYSYRLYVERVVPAQMQNIRKKLKEKSSQNPKIAHP